MDVLMNENDQFIDGSSMQTEYMHTVAIAKLTIYIFYAMLLVCIDFRVRRKSQRKAFFL